jgi:hypothetical protein
MAEKKHAHLIKPLSDGGWRGAKSDGPGNAAQKVWLNGRDHLEGLNLNFLWAMHGRLGEWHSGLDPHTHPYPELHIFTGLDTANINYLGADIECCIGEEQETYTFNEPTAVVVPAGMPHGPTTTKRIYSPKGFAFYLVGLSSVPRTDGLKKNSKPAKSTGKYAHLFKPLKSALLTERGQFNESRFTPEQLVRRAETSKKTGMKLGPGNADHLTWMYGRDLEGLQVNLDWGFFSKTGLWHRGVGAHLHPVDEVLVFVGTDHKDINYLGAEIEIDLGREHEKYIINKPSVVICPAGLPHAPIVARWVDKPYAFFSINLSGEPETRYVD